MQRKSLKTSTELRYNIAEQFIITQKERPAGPAGGAFSLSFGLLLLHALLIALNHLFYHLASHGTSLAGGDVAVIALLQVDANLL